MKHRKSIKRFWVGWPRKMEKNEKPSGKG